MIHTIALTLIFGKPAIMYGGLLTFFLLVFTAYVGYTNFKGRPILPFKWHPRLAIITIIVGIMHGLLGLSIYFNF
jgi:hypothetical protein